MAEIRVRDQNGQYIRKEVLSRKAAIVRGRLEGDTVVTEDDDDVFKPKVAQRVEYDHQGDISQTKTVCGETEKRRDADEGPEMTIEGIITSEQLPKLKSFENADATLISDVHSGPIYVGRLTIEQNTDITHYIENGEEKLAFVFQIQTGEQDDNS